MKIENIFAGIYCCDTLFRWANAS